MNDIDTKVIDVMNSLISICKDGEKGFKTAAEESNAPEFQALCKQYSLQRAEFANELTDEVLMLGGDPDKAGSLTGDLHRGWIDVKAAATRHDEDAIVAEVERGEDAARETYEKALASYMPPNITGIVQRQYNEVKSSHDRFSAMQKAAH